MVPDGCRLGHRHIEEAHSRGSRSIREGNCARVRQNIVVSVMRNLKEKGVLVSREFRTCRLEVAGCHVKPASVKRPLSACSSFSSDLNVSTSSFSQCHFLTLTHRTKVIHPTQNMYQNTIYIQLCGIPPTFTKCVHRHDATDSFSKPKKTTWTATLCSGPGWAMGMLPLQ